MSSIITKFARDQEKASNGDEVTVNSGQSVEESKPDMLHEDTHDDAKIADKAVSDLSLDSHDEWRPDWSPGQPKEIIKDKELTEKSHVKRNNDAGQRSEKKRHCCQMCEKSFSFRCHLRRHMHAKHERKRDFKCDVCNKCFISMHNLQKHLCDKTIVKKKDSANSANLYAHVREGNKRSGKKQD